MAMGYHVPVLKNEVLAHLKVSSEKKYIDATLGDGGHAIEILARGGLVLGIDVNEQSLQRATQRISEVGYGLAFTPVLGNFERINNLAEQNEFESVDGIIYDLGYSSFQLEESDLGISFLKDVPLDMRLDKNLGVTAADLVNSLGEKELTKLIYMLSDELNASKFAKAIVKARSLKKIQTTKQLAELLDSVSSPGYEHGRIHPATRTFQALRIAVNDELESLERSLPLAARLLLPGGRLIVISFHSLEDRIVKQFGKHAQPRLKILTAKPIEPSEQEIVANPRARSAKMRVFEKL